MEQVAGASAPAMNCPLCGKPVYADFAGFVECPCGWGGPDDPVESARGFSRAVTLFDRRMASRIARRDLQRIAERKGPTSPRGPLYLLTLLALSTLIYATMAALAAGAIWLLIFYVEQGFWVAVVLDVAFLLYLYTAIFGFPTRSRAKVAPISDYPRLEALIRQVAEQVKVKAPRWIVFTADANFFIGRRMLWGKALFPQITLGVGVPALTLLSEQELCAILAHELAHDRFAHTLGALYFGYAEQTLRNIISAARLGMDSNSRGSRQVFRASNNLATFGVLLGVVVVWIVMLPLRLLWVIYYFLRLRLSRSDEFRADAEAVRLYGAQTFINGYTGIRVTRETMRGIRDWLRQSIRQSGEPNYFAALRRHFAGLPQDVIGKLRITASREYRTLQSTHPTSPDRIRAALLEAGAPPPTNLQDPAWRVITPKGASSPEALEIELTKRFFT